jgi:hypothetical protein
MDGDGLEVPVHGPAKESRSSKWAEQACRTGVGRMGERDSHGRRQGWGG